MEIKKSSLNEQRKDFKRDFNDPQLYMCEIVDKEKDELIGVLPFMTFSKLDTMVIINSLAAQINIKSKNLKFALLENTNLLLSAVGENNKYKLNVSIEDLKELKKKEKEEKNDEENGTI